MVDVASKRTYWNVDKNDILHYIIGFFVAAIFFVIPFLCDMAPIYRIIARYFIQPIIAIASVLYIGSRKNFIQRDFWYTFLVLVVFCFIAFLVSIINKNELIHVLGFILSLLILPIFFIAIAKEHRFAVIKGMSFYLRIVIIGYFLSVMFFRENGLYNLGLARNYYLWGHVNMSIKMAMPAIVIFAVIDLWRNKKISVITWLFTWLTLAIQFYTESYTAAVGMCIYIATLILFTLKPQLARILPHWSPLLLSLFIFVVICMAQLLIFQRVMAVGGYFGRSASISARATIWSQGLLAIQKHPFGYGVDCDFTRLIGTIYWQPESAHNLYIDVAIKTGIVGVAIFVTFLYWCMKNMPDWGDWPIIPAALFAFAVMWDFEPYFDNNGELGYMMLLFVLLSLKNIKQGVK